MPSSILSALAAVWPLNESDPDGNRYSYRPGGTLSAVNGPGRVAGKIGFGAQFVASGHQRLSCASSDALSLGEGWWIWTWVKLASLPTSAGMGLISKRDDNVGTEYSVYLDEGPNLVATAFAPDNSSVIVGLVTGASTGSWHLAEAWLDPADGTLNVAWDGGAPASVAKTTTTRNAGATFHLGCRVAGSGHLDGSLNTPSIRKQAPTPEERAAIWAAGAGLAYPYGDPVAAGTATATLDNTGGADAVPAGAPLPLWLPASFFDRASLVYPNGDDLSATAADGNPLLLWPEVVDAGDRYGRVWVETPASGVAAGQAAGITVHYGDPDHFATADYDTLFAKRSTDAGTIALYHLDSVDTATTPEAGGGSDMALVGSPALADVDGGNFRSLRPRQRFADGGYLSFDGASQHATVTGLLDDPPPSGCISAWLAFPAALADPAAVILCKASVYDGTDIVEGVTLESIPVSGSPRIGVKVWRGGGATVADFELGSPWDSDWHHFVLSWGTALRLWVDGCLYAETALVGSWEPGSDAPFCLGAKFLAAASAHHAVWVDELEVRDEEPARADVLRWLNRGGLPQTYDADRWVRSPDNPINEATLTVEQPAIGETRMLRRGPGDWIGEQTNAGATVEKLLRFYSTDGKSIDQDTKGTVVMGDGIGGDDTHACRGNLFRDTDGTMYLYYTKVPATDGADLWYATTDDDGETWTEQGIVMAAGGDFPGLANSTVCKVGATYHWLIEVRDGGYFPAAFTSTTPTGPLTPVADQSVLRSTLQQGGGGVSIGRLIHVGGRFHFFPHANRQAGNLPTQMYHAVSDDSVRWEMRCGGDPIIDLDFTVDPHADQVGNAWVQYLPDSGEVAIIYEVGNNRGGGLHGATCVATFTGSLADLADEYPQLTLGAVSSGAGGAALLMAAA